MGVKHCAILLMRIAYRDKKKEFLKTFSVLYLSNWNTTTAQAAEQLWASGNGRNCELLMVDSYQTKPLLGIYTINTALKTAQRNIVKILACHRIEISNT